MPQAKLRNQETNLRGQSEHSQVRRAIIGFVIGAAVPVSLGVNMYVHEIAYRSSLPRAPNSAFCGMGMLAAFVLVFTVGPVCSAVGAAISEFIRKQ